MKKPKIDNNNETRIQILELFNKYALRQINWDEDTSQTYLDRLKLIDLSDPDQLIRSLRWVRMHRAHKTYNLTLTALKNIRLAIDKFDHEEKFTEFTEVIEDLEDQRIKKPSVSNSKSYTEEERRAILEYRSDYFHMSFWLAFNTGMRAEEIEDLNVSDIDLDSGIITVQAGKGDKKRFVVIADTRKIENYLKIRNIHVRSGKIKGDHFLYNRDGNRPNLTGSGAIFTNAKKGTKTKPGLGFYPSLHRARADFITRSLRNGVNIDIVSQQAGHESLDTTKGYIDTTVEEMQRQLKKQGLLEE